jgi:hypothetical protein
MYILVFLHSCVIWTIWHQHKTCPGIVVQQTLALYVDAHQLVLEPGLITGPMLHGWSNVGLLQHDWLGMAGASAWIFSFSENVIIYVYMCDGSN